MEHDKYFEFAENIPLDELYQEIRKITDLKDLKFTSKVTTDRHDRPYLQFESEDLVEKVGFLKLMFKTIKICQFNSQISTNTDTNEMYWWGTVSFQYDHPSGGSNGYTFLQCRYRDKIGWEFAAQ